jgi:hypothetical protein
MAFPSGAD